MKGTSITFSCWTGPCPKYPSSPNNSPWSDVIVTYVSFGIKSNNSSTTSSRYRTASIWRLCSIASLS